ncbi:MAG: hypothetical protein M1330_05085 [Armatimonadetes bacterium]|nr:hypothetical protein [Armatimonadota bacterium]
MKKNGTDRENKPFIATICTIWFLGAVTAYLRASWWTYANIEDRHFVSPPQWLTDTGLTMVYLIVLVAGLVGVTLRILRRLEHIR